MSGPSKKSNTKAIASFITFAIIAGIFIYILDSAISPSTQNIGGIYYEETGQFRANNKFRIKTFFVADSISLDQAKEIGRKQMHTIGAATFVYFYNNRDIPNINRATNYDHAYEMVDQFGSPFIKYSKDLMGNELVFYASGEDE